MSVTIDLTGKTALITGGGRGIGRAIALGFARAGATVCVTARTQVEIESVVAEIREHGQEGFAHLCDISDFSAVEQMVAAAAKDLERIDILVNNAGGGEERNLIGEDDPENWAKVIQTNLIGTYYVCRTVIGVMKDHGGGNIINVGSGMGHQSRVGNSSYNTAKAGQWMLTRCLAEEAWKEGITVNELIPGPVVTQLTEEIFKNSQPHPQFNSEWVKQPDDIVPLALFLASQPRTGPTAQSFSLARRPI